MSSSRAVSRLAVNPGGRSNVSGLNAVVFGSSGFYGRYFVDRLGRMGSQVLVPFRGDGMEVRHLRVLGDVGQVTPVPFELRDTSSIQRSVAGSNVVINLIGRGYETRNYKFEDVHVTGAAAIAKAAKQAGAERFVHVSALGANAESESSFLRSKALGEQAVLAEFPSATIFRPAVTFGWEDRFVNRYAKWAAVLPVVPLVKAGHNKIQPVFVEDVADAMMAVLNRSDAAGSVFELGGPDVMHLRDILKIICEDLNLSNNTITLPNALAMMYSRILELSPWPPLLTRDEVRQMQDDIQVSSQAHDLESLSIAPTSVLDKLHMLLSMYRSGRSYVETTQKAE